MEARSVGRGDGGQLFPYLEPLVVLDSGGRGRRGGSHGRGGRGLTTALRLGDARAGSAAMKRLAWAVVVPLWLCGCGPKGALWLQVNAPLVVPQSCDGLEIMVHHAPDGGMLFDQTYALTQSEQFPLTLELTAEHGQDFGAPLTVEATALKSGQLAAPWAEAAYPVTLSSGQVTYLTLSICACATPPCGCDGGV
jgi:hypothetical protein